MFSARAARPTTGPERSYLRYDELYFDRGIRSDAMRWPSWRTADAERLLGNAPCAGSGGLTVALYRTPGNRFAAMQAFEYADLEYKPLTGAEDQPADKRGLANRKVRRCAPARNCAS